MTYAYGTKLAGGARPPFTGAPSTGPTLPTVFLGGLPQLYGEEVFRTAGTYTWTVPRSVHTVSVVCIGGGTGDGSATTSSGTSHFNNSLYAFGSSSRTGGGFAGADGGGVGGTGGLVDTATDPTYGTNTAGGAGGGAGGYGGKGGDAGTSSAGAPTVTDPTDYIRAGGGGGGVGIYGLGASGQGAEQVSSLAGPGDPGEGGGGGGGSGPRVSAVVQLAGKRGQGGSGGTPSTNDVTSSLGGDYGGGYGRTASGYGGGGLGWKNNIRVLPGQQIPIKVGTDGAVRIIWGTGRTFPVNAQ
jgi:hypothetical protein